MEDLSYSINKILSEWNPINLPESIAAVEYRTYVKEVIDKSATQEETVKLLEDIVTRRMGLSDDSCKLTHKNRIFDVADKICSLVRNTSVVPRVKGLTS